MAILTGKTQYRIGFLKKLILQVEIKYFDSDMDIVKNYIDATFKDLQKLKDIENV